MGTNKNNSLKSDLAKDLHNTFLENMESSYAAILNFLGFIVPGITGFFYLVYTYYRSPQDDKPYTTFLVGTIAIILFLVWGGSYTLSISYRYRYLQASVYKIEESFGADYYIPLSFKPKPYKGIKRRILMDMAPAVLQTHIFFFLFFIISICGGFIFLTDWNYNNIILIVITFFSVTFLYYLGAFFYPKKINKIISDLNKELKINKIKKYKLFFLTGPSAVGKSTLRNYYCNKKKAKKISALTTRLAREFEVEIHRTVNSKQFNKLLKNKKLCFISENFGFKYAYLIKDIKSYSRRPKIIELDSKTAVNEQKKLKTCIIRILPVSKEEAIKKLLLKRNNIKSRLKDLDEQLSSEFILERQKAGDYLFINQYNQKSLNDFCELINRLS